MASTPAQRRAERRRRSGLPPRRKRRQTLSPRIIESVAREEGPGVLASLGSALALSGDLFRGVISGQPGERVEPRELLAKLGIEPEAKFDVTNVFSEGGLSRFGAGVGVLATDIFTDPLTLLAGVGQLGKSAKAIKGATEAIGRAQALAKGGRKLVPRKLRQGEAAGSELLQKVRERALSKETLSGAVRAETRTAKELLEALPERLRPKDLFRDGKPLLGRLRKRAGPTAADRELFSLGVPFTKLRGRVPLPIPRKLETLAIGAVAKPLGAAKRGLKRAFGRGVPESSRTISRFFQQSVRKTAEEIGQDIAARADELVAIRAASVPGASFDDVAAEIKNKFQVDIRNAREPGKAGSEKLKSLSANEREFASDLNEIVDGATEAQIATGARNDARIEDYAERALSTYGRDLIRKHRLSGEFADHMNAAARIHEGSQVRRKGYLREMLTTDANAFFAKKFPELKGENFFNLDPAVTVELAIRDRGLSVVQANLASSLIDDFAGMSGRVGDVPITTFISQIGLKSFRQAKWSGSGVEVVTKALADAGVDITQTIPIEVAKEFGDMVGVLGRGPPGGWEKWLRDVYDPTASLYRGGATTIFPGFHARNNTGNVILNMLAGVRNPKFYAQAIPIAFKAVRGGGGKQVEHLRQLGVIRGGQTRQIFEEAGTLETLRGGNPIQRLLGRVQGSAPFRAGLGVGDFVENSARVAHFLSKKADGLTDFAAVESVNKFLFNYGKDALSAVERSVANRLFFFYRWQRYALPLVLGQLFENPARSAALLKFTTQPAVDRPVGIPEFLRESAGIPQSVDPTTGETRFISRFGSPFEAIGFIDPTGGSGTFGGITKGLREGAGLLLPPLRAALELLSGEEFFLGREISDLDRGSATGSRIGEFVSRIPGLEQLGKDIGEEVPTGRPGITKQRRAPGLRFLLRNLPTSRTTSSIARLLDSIGESINISRGEPSRQLHRRELPEELRRLLFGINQADVDTKAEVIRQFRRVLGRQADDFRASGKAKQIEIPYLTPTGKLDPEAIEVFDLLSRIKGKRSL